jgi:hypothetical protein
MSRRVVEHYHFKAAGYMYIILGSSFSFISGKDSDVIGFLLGGLIITIGFWMKGK